MLISLTNRAGTSSVLKCHSADGLCLFKVSYHHVIAYDFEAVNECEDTSQPLYRSLTRAVSVSL